MSGTKNFAYQIIDMFPTTKRVDMVPSTYGSNFIATTPVETVAILAKGESYAK